MALGSSTADRIERFLGAHPTGPLVVCVGSASVAGIVWLAQRSHDRPVTLLIGDLKSRNFAKATDADRRAALSFVQRRDVTVLNWYRTGRSSQGRSEAHLKVWAACDHTGTPQAFLVGSANLTMAGLNENVEVMALTDASEYTYLNSTLQRLRDKAWDARERLEEAIEQADAPDDRHHPRGRRSGRTSAGNASRRQASAASTGCGSQVLTVASLATATALLIRLGRRLHTSIKPT
ncbi:MAG: hypothetical protein OXC06_00135 [Acidimicrobiaceae bacterium]|nr:hypothetical protein [Acidimicrobiaceae bacterium]